MQLRAYRPGDEPAMLALMYSSVHTLGKAGYTPAQLTAWIPGPVPDDLPARARRFAKNHTLLAVRPAPGAKGEALLGWADMDDTGYLDHLFVSPGEARQGVATALTAALEAWARQNGLATMTTYASLTARPFFEKQGFRLVKPNIVTLRGEQLANFFMEKPL